MSLLNFVVSKVRFDPGEQVFRDYARDYLKVDHSNFGRIFLLHGSKSKLSYSETVDSDYDYATECNVFSEEKLLDLGWKELSDMAYIDSNTVSIYEKTLEGKLYQISFRHDLKQFKSVWSNIDSHLYRQVFWKKSPTYIGKEGVSKLLDAFYYTYNEGTYRKDVVKSYGISAKDCPKPKPLQEFLFGEPVLANVPVGEPVLVNVPIQPPPF